METFLTIWIVGLLFTWGVLFVDVEKEDQGYLSLGAIFVWPCILGTWYATYISKK